MPSRRTLRIAAAAALFVALSPPAVVPAQPTGGPGCPPHCDAPLAAPGLAGPGGPMISEDIVATAVYDPDGPGAQPPLIVAAGTFTSAGGQPIARIAAWDGVRWTQMGSAVGMVRCLMVYDDDGPG